MRDTTHSLFAMSENEGLHLQGVREAFSLLARTRSVGLAKRYAQIIKRTLEEEDYLPRPGDFPTLLKPCSLDSKGQLHLPMLVSLQADGGAVLAIQRLEIAAGGQTLTHIDAEKYYPARELLLASGPDNPDETEQIAA